MRKVFWLLSLLAIPLALTGINNYFSGVYLATSTGFERISGYDAPLTANPNDLALMLNIILPLTIALLLMSRRLSARLVLLAGIGCSAAAILMTFSRAGFLTLAVLLILYCWRLRRRRERRWVWGLIPVILTGVILIGPAYMERLSTITNMHADKTFSAQERWSDMTAAARFTREHPIIGAGLGQNVLATREERGPDGGLVHNVYLEYAAELGLPGLALFLALFILCLKSTRLVQAFAKEAGDKSLFYIGEAIQLSLIAFGISAMFHPVAYHVHFYYLAGLAVAAKNIVTADRTGHENK
jgi:O-antigen ligase